MKFEQRPHPRETEQETKYIIGDLKLDRDDILEEAALSLENDPKFPDPRGEKANHLRAKQAIRETLRKNGAKDDSLEDLEKQISNDAYEVLNLFSK